MTLLTTANNFASPIFSSLGCSFSAAVTSSAISEADLFGKYFFMMSLNCSNDTEPFGCVSLSLITRSASCSMRFFV